VIANSEFGSIFDALLGQENVKFETGGCLDGGRRVWMLALLDEPVIIAGDNKTATYPYITLMSRHDARGAAALRATNVRIVCMNTFNVAELQGEQTGLTYSFTHRQNWRDHLDEAREAVTGVRREAAAYQDLAENLMQVKVTPKQEKLFVAEFFPMPPKGEASDRTLANVTSSRNAIDQILAGPTVGEAGIRGTAYGLMQAAGEYSDHARQARSWETRLKRTLLQPEPQKARALQLIREVCELAA
jgi:phage/plasmid-like protein (TIGR03299 family)